MLENIFDRVSDELVEKVSSLDGDIITIRNDPDVKVIWNKLCRLHMKAMVSCEYDPINREEIARLCQELSKPRICITLLKLSEEQTCCSKFLEKISPGPI